MPYHLATPHSTNVVFCLLKQVHMNQTRKNRIAKQWWQRFCCRSGALWGQGLAGSGGLWGEPRQNRIAHSVLQLRFCVPLGSGALGGSNPSGLGPFVNIVLYDNNGLDYKFQQNRIDSNWCTVATIPQTEQNRTLVLATVASCA